MSAYFKPEFLNRFDSIIEFEHLKREDLIQIVSLMVNELQETLAEQGIQLSISSEAKEKLAELGYHPAFGARPLRRVIQEQLEDQITDLLLAKAEAKSLQASVKDGCIIVE